MTYGYARISDGATQKLDRQIMLLKEQGIDERHILCDKASGKDFERKAYNSLVGTTETAPVLREGDLLVLVSLDRLGRNYGQIRQQWEHITQTLKVDIKVLDMPLLDTSTTGENLEKRFMADLVLQILSYVAEKERLSIAERREAGVRAAKEKGKHIGRPKAEYPSNWKAVYDSWKEGEITAKSAMESMDMRRTTFYKLVKQYEV